MKSHSDILKSTGYNRIFLFFDDPVVEKMYVSDNDSIAKNSMRSGLVYGSLLLTLFSAVEMYSGYAKGATSVDFLYAVYSYVFFIPIIALVYVLSYSKLFFVVHEYVVAFIMFLLGTSTNLGYFISKDTSSISSHFSVILIFIYAFYILRNRFAFTLVVCLLIFLEYIFVQNLKISDINLWMMGTVSVFIGLLLSIIAGYKNELLVRREYLLIERINKENEIREKHNELLEKEVKRRTNDLMVANIALKKAMQKAESSDVLKSTILANISHEIRPPLTRILGFSELLTRGTLSVEKKQQYVGIIEDSTNQLLGIVTNVIELSKLQSDHQTIQNATFYLYELLEDLRPMFIEMSSKMMKRDVLQFNIIKPEIYENVLITTDLEKLKKILTNLLHNAIKFTPSGQIVVSFRFLEENYLEFCVTDEGIGVEEDKIDMIFDYFRQENEGSTRKYGGTGVGLSICKGLVINLGGKIWVSSEKGKGSRFYFTVPIKQL